MTGDELNAISDMTVRLTELHQRSFAGIAVDAFAAELFEKLMDAYLNVRGKHEVKVCQS